jgi:carbon monoxide dehydrogenase subunit G
VNLKEHFEVTRSRDDVVEVLCRDETLLELLPEGDTEIVESEGDRRTTETRYRALGREGVAKFEFTFLMDGGIRFSKVCDGNVWKKLEGLVSVEEIDDESCEVSIELSGKTKTLVPEFTIKAPMEDQIHEMTLALEAKLSG